MTKQSRAIVRIDRKYALWSRLVEAPLTDFQEKMKLVRELRVDFGYSEPEIRRLFAAQLTARDVEQNRAGELGAQLTKDELLAQYS